MLARCVRSSIATTAWTNSWASDTIEAVHLLQCTPHRHMDAAVIGATVHSGMRDVAKLLGGVEDDGDGLGWIGG